MEILIKDENQSSSLQEAGKAWSSTIDRFNTWFLQVAKKSYNEDRIIEILEGLEMADREIILSWKDHKENPAREKAVISAIENKCKLMDHYIKGTRSGGS